MDNFNKKNSLDKFQEDFNLDHDEGKDFYVKEIDWRNSCGLPEKEDLYNQKIFNKMLTEYKEDLLSLIAKGNIQFSYSKDFAILTHKRIIKNWLKKLKQCFINGPQISADLFVRLYLDEKNNIILQILWEIPLAQINDRHLINKAIVSFCHSYNGREKDSFVELILNKKNYRSSNLIGVIFNPGILKDKKLNYEIRNA